MRRDDLRQLLTSRVLVSDGAMGSLLQSQGALQSGGCPEAVTLQRPEMVEAIHGQYVQAGCDLVQTNTLGANRLKLGAYGLAEQVERLNQAAVHLARRAAGSRVLVAGDIGSCGQLLHPLGPLAFEQVTEAFFQQAKALLQAEVDLFLIETMFDLHEAKAAVMAARAASSTLPIICSLTYDQDLRTLTGADPETVVTVLEALGVDVVGVNCGFGPERMGEVLERQYRISDSLLLVQPNAGLPHWRNGRTVFTQGPEEFARFVGPLVRSGANIIGGCCGTTPEHLSLMVQFARQCTPLPRQKPNFSKLAGVTEAIYISDHLPTQVIGERINPTARKRLAEALGRREFGVVAEEAAAQIEAGARVVDINVGTRTAGASEPELMQPAVMAAQRAVNLPLSIDTADAQTMELGLQVCRGKALLNSTTGEEDKLEQVTDLASRYGAAILGLTLDGRGIPATAEERLAIAQRIVERAVSKGIRREDVYIDGLTLTAGASQSLVPETLRTIRLVKERLGVRTALGVSNVSHGLPARAALNNAFLCMALAAGLDLPIVNPSQEGIWPLIHASDVIVGRDNRAKRYVSLAGGQTQTQRHQPQAELTPEQRLQADLLAGDQDRIPALCSQLLQQGWAALRIVNEVVIPAMEAAGERYDQRRFFLPQLLMAAEAAEATVRQLLPQLEQTSTELLSGTVVLATVRGDIHDIGKSIVGLLLRNHGFRVIDLGKDVQSDLIVETAKREQADLIALSALMTTTMPEMGVVAAKVRSFGLSTPVLIGGAVVSSDYAASIGAHYAADATEAVRQAKHLVRGGEKTCKGCGNA